MDTRTPQQRRHIMQSVGTANTAPELIVRRLLHRLGYRFRLHARDLPGRPDVVFRKRHKAVFVHGCFWHGHGCAKGALPKSRLDYWGPKIAKNRARDASVVGQLKERGWDTIVVWQCETRDLEVLERRLASFLR